MKHLNLPILLAACLASSAAMGAQSAAGTADGSDPGEPTEPMGDEVGARLEPMVVDEPAAPAPAARDPLLDWAMAHHRSIALGTFFHATLDDGSAFPAAQGETQVKAAALADACGTLPVIQVIGPGL